jgi:hypothetical protein
MVWKRNPPGISSRCHDGSGGIARNKIFADRPFWSASVSFERRTFFHLFFFFWFFPSDNDEHIGLVAYSRTRRIMLVHKRYVICVHVIQPRPKRRFSGPQQNIFKHPSLATALTCHTCIRFFLYIFQVTHFVYDEIFHNYMLLLTRSCCT